MVEMHIAPPFAASFLSRPSSRLRGWSCAERRLECESRIGYFDSASSWSKVASDEWLASMTMPSRFIRATHCRPSGLRPFQRGLSVALSANWLFNPRSEEHTSELQSLMRISYAVFCLKKKKKLNITKKETCR